MSVKPFSCRRGAETPRTSLAHGAARQHRSTCQRTHAVSPSAVLFVSSTGAHLLDLVLRSVSDCHDRTRRQCAKWVRQSPIRPRCDGPGLSCAMPYAARSAQCDGWPAKEGSAALKEERGLTMSRELGRVESYEVEGVTSNVIVETWTCVPSWCWRAGSGPWHYGHWRTCGEADPSVASQSRIQDAWRRAHRRARELSRVASPSRRDEMTLGCPIIFLLILEPIVPVHLLPRHPSPLAPGPSVRQAFAHLTRTISLSSLFKHLTPHFLTGIPFSAWLIRLKREGRMNRAPQNTPWIPPQDGEL